MFGRHPPEIKIDFEQLPNYLDQCFDAKLKDLASNASRIMKALESAKYQFEKACDDFEKNESEPDTEDTPRLSVSYIKGSKAAYIKSLRSVLVRHQHAESGRNIYSRYNYEQLQAEEMINSVLKTNMQFSAVLLGYSDRLGDFKRAFSTIEKCNKNLKDEMGMWSAEEEEHARISNEIGRINTLTEGRAALRSAIERISSQKIPHGIDQKPQDAQMLDEEKGRLRELEGRRSSLEAEIASMMMPLERAARKYDHSVGKHSSASDYITKPTQKITDGASYSEFQRIIGVIYKEMEAGRLEIKNRAAAQRSFDAIMSGDVLNDIEAARSLDDQLSEKRSIVKDLERVSEELRAHEYDAKTMEEEKAELQHNDEEMAAEQESIRKSIEEEFAKFYNVKVSIIM